jgi:hypothetical protein
MDDFLLLRSSQEKSCGFGVKFLVKQKGKRRADLWLGSRTLGRMLLLHVDLGQDLCLLLLDLLAMVRRD